MGLLSFLKKRKRKNVSDNTDVDINVKSNDDGFSIAITKNGKEIDFSSLSKKEKHRIANALYEKKKSKDANNSNDSEVIIEDYGSVSIPRLNFYGFNPFLSNNKNYMICTTDGHLESIDDETFIKNGELVACKENTVLFHKKMSRPQKAKVSNNGVFIVNNWVDFDSSYNSFHVFSENGTLIFEKKVYAGLYNNGISQDGKYACFETCGADNDDGDKLFIIDLLNKNILSSFSPVTSLADSYCFDISNKTISLYFKHEDISYKYGFNGTFLDQEKYENNKLNAALANKYGYNLKDIALQKLSKLSNNENLCLDDYSEIIDIMNQALDKEMSDYHKAVCYRKVGEVFENFDCLEQAINNYKQAVNHYPKIGVKRKINNISKKLRL
ncbi:hypothetical protein [Dethiothermospora halolimnae]|uniref:hypothetical protein n=1 Tax=Dethiothermospora halolimnae TaxID=3114390 RepID=UPI003CCBB247